MAPTEIKTTVRRDVFKSFWNKYSDSPDNNAMMLNHNAEELEGSDRADILSALPNLTDKDVVDIGAGIGRFTTILARTAKSVLSTDFIDSFIVKNRERNSHLANVNYKVGDAVHLVLDHDSVDLVFTNWLMMYLSDNEVLEFLYNAIRWLRPDGYLHLRESCSEPSTGRSKSTMHSSSDANPTSYRFSSLYIKLLRTIRYRCPQGKLWRFEVLWSASVPTYVQRQSNWRQVHWLTRKVPADESDWVPTTTEMLQLFSFEWNRIQNHWDNMLDNERNCWTDRIFGSVMSSEFVPKNSTVLAYTPRRSAFHVHINAHLLAEKFTCNVWSVETSEYYYRTSLSKANELKDQRVRFGWNRTLQSSIDYWSEREGSFNALVATELLGTVDDETLSHLSAVLKPEAKIVTLEPLNEEVGADDIKKRLSAVGWRSVVVMDVTEPAKELQKEYFKKHNIANEAVLATSRWVLVEATL